MTEERTVWVEGNPYTVVLSDESEALLAAQAAGRAVVGVETAGEEPVGSAGEAAEESAGSAGKAAAKRIARAGEDPRRENVRPDAAGHGGFLPARYIVASPAVADGRYLERVVRRHLGLPWEIAETERLRIREFTAADAAAVPRENGDTEADRVFCTPKLLEAYIRNQYQFCEYGVWALIDKRSGALVGKAGVTAAGDDGPEIGYHIFEPYRRQGYASEACRGILAALKEEYEGERVTVCARTDPANAASIRVLENCGFRLAAVERPAERESGGKSAADCEAAVKETSGTSSERRKEALAAGEFIFKKIL